MTGRIGETFRGGTDLAPSCASKAGGVSACPQILASQSFGSPALPMRARCGGPSAAAADGRDGRHSDRGDGSRDVLVRGDPDRQPGRHHPARPGGTGQSRRDLRRGHPPDPPAAAALRSDTPLASYHDHNKARVVPRIVARLQGGQTWPWSATRARPASRIRGSAWCARCATRGSPWSTCRGRRARWPAWCSRDFRPDRFVFAGYPPRKKGARAALPAGAADRARHGHPAGELATGSASPWRSWSSRARARAGHRPGDHQAARGDSAQAPASDF